MPTPFMHLQIAENIRAQIEANKPQNGRLADLIGREWPAFYLGSVAPDYQTVCNVPREQTHFYDLPPAPDDDAYSRMLATYPEIADGSLLPPAQAVFIGAYIIHLMYDLLWFRHVLIPYFVNAPHVGDRKQRYLVHNILLTYLDKLALESLPETAAENLQAADPHEWLPFAEDAHLVCWRDMLTAQLQPGGITQTVQIYAARLHMTAAEFALNLDDPEWMQRHVFDKVPVDEIRARLEAAVPASIALLADYLGASKATAQVPWKRDIGNKK